MAKTNLADLMPGQSAVVDSFVEQSPVVQRMMQLGLLPGERVEVVRRAPGGDPVEFRVMGYALSLRRSEAALVSITREA